MLQFLKHIVCPCCRATDRYQVSIDPISMDRVSGGRVILDCGACEFRLSLPLDLAKFEKPEWKSMPLEFHEDSKVIP